ncbi:DinB family protein [Flavobacterium aquariorum]|uniref:DinB family protein n=1 Tax=Flavobacterium aquariorum TaxID=2217670 RepID=A0A2W7TYT2_9FLAO|nr:DinB family protein [Flavobacterium aquariorum]PZX95198.1 DinB family protein [Flavobacterium aquariorum]
MQDTFEVNRTSRKMLSSYFENYTLEQLNKIPEGFSNNLIWNLGHVIVTQQLLVYKLSGLPMEVSDEMVEKYRKGTKPEHDVTQAEVDEIKALLLKSVDQLEADYNNGIFVNYQEYPTSTGYILKSAKGAIEFNNFHEGLHIGIMMSIRKFI